MMAFTLRYLFYAGIIVPTLLTLALFIFFVICWRRQSARKLVLTKPYDPHGTMRKKGIANRPPPPPMFLRDTTPMCYGTAGPSSPLDEHFGGEDNAAYDMSRSPSAEANTGQHTNTPNTMTSAGLHHLRLHFDGGVYGVGGAYGGVDGGAYGCGPGGMDHGIQLMQFSPSSDSHLGAYHGAGARGGVGPRGPGGPVQFSPSGELNLGPSGHPPPPPPPHHQLAYHSRLDSGLSEPACESPGNASTHSSHSNHSGGRNEGGGSGGGGGGNGGGGGGSGGVCSQDRPQSQASHSSLSTDSEDSGFRSSRSGHFTQSCGVGGGGAVSSSSTTTTTATTHAEAPSVLRRSRSAGRGGNKGGRGYYHKAATSSPDSETEPGIQLTPTALWPHHYNHVPTSSPTHSHPHNPHHPHHHMYHHHSNHSDEDTCVKTSAVDLKLTTAPHIEWKYLQDLASPPGLGSRGRAPVPGTHRGLGNQVPQPQQPHQQQKTMTCHQMTMAQVHSSHDLDNPDVFGFSVV